MFSLELAYMLIFPLGMVILLIFVESETDLPGKPTQKVRIAAANGFYIMGALEAVKWYGDLGGFHLQLCILAMALSIFFFSRLAWGSSMD